MRFVFPVIFIITTLIVFFTMVKPLYQDVRDLHTLSGQYAEALARTEDLKQTRERLATKYQSFTNEELDRLLTILPDSIDNVRLILDVDDIARRHGMRARNISVTSDMEAGGVVGRGVAREENDEPYSSLTFSFSTIGPYSNFSQFMNDLERSLRLVDVSELSISTTDTTDLDYSITLKAYWLN